MALEAPAESLGEGTWGGGGGEVLWGSLGEGGVSATLW